jgi:hypothetical protein
VVLCVFVELLGHTAPHDPSLTHLRFDLKSRPHIHIMFHLARKTIANQATATSALRQHLVRNASSVPVAGSAAALSEWTANKKLQAWVAKHGK